MAVKKRIIIGSDHAGFGLKEQVKADLSAMGFTLKDVGTCRADEPSDYPGYAAKVAMAVSTGVFERGVLVCGTGMGTSIAANRFPFVRAVVCTTLAMAITARQKLNCNVLVLGSEYSHALEIPRILKVWLDTGFEGGRHARRVRLIDDNNMLNLALGHLDHIDVANISDDRVNKPFLKRALAGLQKIQKSVLPPEKRRTDDERQTESSPAIITHDNEKIKAILVELSEKGAQFQISKQSRHPEFIRDDDVDMEIKTTYGTSSCKGLIRWYDTKSRHLGVQFSRFPTKKNDPLRLLLDSML